MFRGTELTRFFSLLMLINSAAPIFGPVIGGQIMRISGWTSIFFLLCACGIAQFTLVARGCPETLPSERRSSGGISASLRKMKNLLGNRAYMCYLLVQGFIMAGFFGYVAASPFVLQKIYGLSAQQYSLSFAANGIGIMIAAQITGRICAVYGDRAILRFGACISLASAACVAVVCILHLAVSWLLVFLGLFVSCMGIISTTSFSLAIASQKEGAGSASGLLGVASFVFGSVTSPLVGILGDMSAMPMACVAVLSSALVLFFYVAAGTVPANEHRNTR